MNERLKDIPLPVPNDSSQGNGQPLTHLPDFPAPLHERLPPEIFGAIIHLCLGFTTPVRDLVTLQLVCRSWHDIIADASFLWGTINAAEGLLAVHKALQMAKDASLDINYLSETSRINQTEFFKLAREGIHQWRSLVVDSTEWQSALDDLGAQKPPRLEKLHVVTKYYNGPPSNEEIVLFGGDPCPGLKDVRLACVPIHPASLHLSGLRSLDLQEIPSVSAAEVITLITESPDLEILSLRSSHDTELPSRQPDLVAYPPIQLASLTKLCLHYLPPPFLNFLLSVVAVPQLRFLEISGYLDETPDYQLVGVGAKRLGPILSSVSSNAQMYKAAIYAGGSYEIHIGGLLITIQSPDWRPTDHFQETFIWLSGRLKTSLLNLPLHLEFLDLEPQASHLEWFTRHTNVTELSLNRGLWGAIRVEVILLFLSGPISVPPLPPIWLLPQLEVLRTNLVWKARKPNIVDMIKRRHSASSGSPAAGDGALPKRFRAIWLASYGEGGPQSLPDTEFLSKVVAVAEGADVYWEGRKWVVS